MFDLKDYLSYFSQLKVLEEIMYNNIVEIVPLLSDPDLKTRLQEIMTDEKEHREKVEYIISCLGPDTCKSPGTLAEEAFVSLMTSLSQKQIIEHFKSLTRDEKKVLLKDAENLDFALVSELYKSSVSKEESQKKKEYEISPAEVIPNKILREPEYSHKLKILGENLITNNKCAVIVVAGGQGSRLKFDGPKGMYPVSPVKNKSIFQLFSEKVKALRIKYNASIPFVVMTSKENHLKTQEFFVLNRFFGLEPSSVFFIEQSRLPSVSSEGKFLLKSRTQFLTNPDGHGGLFSALSNSGLLLKLIETKVEILFCFQVDNPLVNILDPVFVGLHYTEKAEMSTKVVRRRNCEEKVGIYITKDGKASIIEYSDLKPENICMLNDKGEIRDWAGNIAIHLINAQFIARLTKGLLLLPYHRAVKKNQVYDLETGMSEKEVWKYETFLFDALIFSAKNGCMETERETEFAPIKSLEGVETPENASKAISSFFRNWLLKSGIEVPASTEIEISPLFALDIDEFKEKIRNKSVDTSKNLYLDI